MTRTKTKARPQARARWSNSPLRNLCNHYPGKVDSLAEAMGVQKWCFYRMLRGSAVRSMPVMLEQLAVLFTDQGGTLKRRGGTVEKLRRLWGQAREAYLEGIAALRHRARNRG